MVSPKTLVFKPNERTKVINCLAIGGRPFEVSWYRNGYPYSSDAEGQSSNVLELNQPNINDSGTYTCRANDSISSIEQIINITIACKLEFILSVLRSMKRYYYRNVIKFCIYLDVPYFKKQEQFSVIRATVGDTVTLKMDIGGYPKPILEWEFPPLSDYNNVTVDNVTSHEIHDDGTLILRGITIRDQGSYRCTAINAFGAVSTSLEITVVPIEPRRIGRGTVIIAIACGIGYVLVMIGAYFYCRNIKDKKAYDTGMSN